MNARSWFMLGIATGVVVGTVISVLRRRRSSNRLPAPSSQSNPPLATADARAATASAPDGRDAHGNAPSETPAGEDEPQRGTRSLEFEAAARGFPSEPQPHTSHVSARAEDRGRLEAPNERTQLSGPEITVRPSFTLPSDLPAPTLLVVEAGSVDVTIAGEIARLGVRTEIPVTTSEESVVAHRDEHEEALSDVDARTGGDVPNAVQQINAESPVVPELQPTSMAPGEGTSAAASETEGTAETEQRRDNSDERVVIDTPEGKAVLTAAVSSEPVMQRPRRSVYRDRRGTRRAKPSLPRKESSQGNVGPAELSLRLSLHPIHQDVRLSVVLARPEGFPDAVTLAVDGQLVRAYDDRRYDDIDVPAGIKLLDDEMRLETVEGFQFLRTARRIQLFSTTAADPDQVSVSAARAGKEHGVLCYAKDVAEVRRIAQLAGSPPPISHEGWPGIPPECAVLSAYIPEKAITEAIEPSLRTLDPGVSISINLSGGLAIRSKVFAQGHPPHISIDDLPDGSSVAIGGQTAQQMEGGGWFAPGWEQPGRHIIDIVPGPSLTYEIAADPISADGWPRWNAYGERFDHLATVWARAEICGAHVAGPCGGVIVASDAQSTVVALGAHSMAVAFRHRPDMPVSIGAVPPDTAFLLVTSGRRRHEGRIIWIGNGAPTRDERSADVDRYWANIVRRAASRRLPLVGADEAGERAWRAAVARARHVARGDRK